MTICKHRGKRIYRSVLPTGEEFDIWHCHKLGQRCTAQQSQMRLQSGEQLPFCAGCPFFERRPGDLELVSAVCLAYDLPRRQTVLEESIESFLRQTYPHKELVIVNDTPGLVIECDAPGVRIINVPPCATLGDKYNAGVEAARGTLICSWDDDDISLPWRMSLSVELLGRAEYFNPRAYWFLNGDTLQHEVRTGYAHNASIFRKGAWQKVGRYQPLADNSQDAAMDTALRAQCQTIDGSGRIEQTAYIYRWGDGLHHGSSGPAELLGQSSGTFRLNPHWERNYTRLTVQARPAATPFWITNRDTLAVRTMVEQLLLCEDLGPITIVDCDSDYGPLLTWYQDECPVNVIQAENLGHLAPWKYLDQSQPYIVADGDFDFAAVPRDFVHKLAAALEKFPRAIKAGLSLSIDDLPDASPLKAQVIAHESKFWDKPIDPEYFDAAIDTTPAMYRAGTGWGGYEPAIRLAPPYVARHVPWYLTPSTTGDDWKHYFRRLDPAGIQWGPLLAEQLDQPERRPPKLTIGMATLRDWPGVWATIQGIRLFHPECLDEIEIIVVDNDAVGDPNLRESHSSNCRNLCSRVGARYDHYTAVAGTAAAKGRIFELATAPAVLVIDCHVLLPAGVIRKLIDWYTDHPDSKDLYQGPLIGDAGLQDIVGTHFAPSWGSLMFGQWAVDKRVYDGEPFEIEMQGCGLFTCRRDAWPGFHPELRGFGPEEYHLHNRIRRKGGKCWCLPWLTWCHRFGNPDGTRPPGLTHTERLRGYLVTHLDTRAPAMASIWKHFVEESHMPAAVFLEVLEQTVAEVFKDRPDLGRGCPNRGPFLRVVDCEIGCAALRAPLPVFSCTEKEECAPYQWQQPHKRDVAVCAGCELNPAISTSQNSE